jgi:hypothetical protein
VPGCLTLSILAQAQDPQAVRNALAALSVSEALPPPRMNALEALARLLAVLRPCSGSMERSDGVLARSRSPCRDRLDER